jgi:hypothetical protein
MNLAHVVITRFSYRGKDAFKGVSGPTFQSAEDPLNPERLELRFKLFELACLPSVLAQTEQGFAWVLLVDRELPAAYAERLRSLIRDRSNSFIHVFDPRSDLGALDWLEAYLPKGADRVVTTNLDDDDSLPTRFAATLNERLGELERAERLPPIAIAGAQQIVQWDLLLSSSAPLGWKARWHRKTPVASAGLSLCCSVPSFRFCVLGLRHWRARDYLDFATPPKHPNVAWFREAVLSAAHNTRVDLRTWQRDAFFYDISQDVGPVLMMNHASNDQAERLFEAKGDRTVVSGPADFPDLPIDWEKARAYLPVLSPSRSAA